MPENTKDRLLNKGAPPAPEEIEALPGADAASRLKGLEAFLQSGCDLTQELKFPFGEHYCWGYKFSRKSRLLCYAFFEKGAFTVTITIGKGELPELYKELPGMLPKTRELWENRYPCGDGGWVHYRVESGVELSDFQKLLSLKIRPARKT